MTTSAKPKHAPFSPLATATPSPPTVVCLESVVCWEPLEVGGMFPHLRIFPWRLLKKIFWRIIALTCCVGFCHTSTWNQPQGYIYPLPLEPPSPLPPHSTLPWLGNLVVLDTVTTLFKSYCASCSPPCLFLSFCFNESEPENHQSGNHTERNLSQV